IVDGGQAEFVAIPERLAMPVPSSISMVEAGGFSEVFSTADDAIFTQCELAMVDRILVTGAAGGVGMAALQLARASGAIAVASVRDVSARRSLNDIGVVASSPD